VLLSICGFAVKVFIVGVCFKCVLVFLHFRALQNIVLVACHGL